MQCVVLAGGLGTRLRPITEAVPKALVPVAGRPFLDRQLEWLAGHGVTEVVLSLGAMGELVERHVGDGSRYGVPVRCIHEGSELRGTGGALRLALDHGALHEDFLVTYGDSFLLVDFGEIGREFVTGGRPALMTVFKNDGRWDRSNVVFDAACGTVVLYDKEYTLRPASDFRYIDYGLSAFRRDTLARAVPAGVRKDLAAVFHDLSLAGELAGLEVFQRFYEIGSPQGLAELERHLGGA
jgi:NDP-sugar pyrophosphorylase family protein